MILLCIAFATGILHGIGPDHLAAITAFGATVGGDFRRIVFFSVRFALGHVVVLGVAGLLAKFGSMFLPERWERIFEVGAGGLLVVFGVLLLIALLSGVIRVHTHVHMHDHSVHGHFHFHWSGLERHEHAHGNMAPLVLGGLFALGGARSLIIALPIALAPTMLESLLRVTAFAGGIVFSMVAYAYLTQRGLQLLTTRVAHGHYTQRIMLGSAYIVALFCVVAGILTIKGLA
jgi:ABC-type nickel/cobalt efflux system permease component RcnA